MRVVTLIVLILFCRAAEFRKAKRNRENYGKGKNSRKGSSTVKRYAPGLPCDVYTYLQEKYLDCQERKQTTVLPDWPEDLIHMLLARNRIRKLKDNMFSRFQNLKSLDLQQNDISKIESQAFFGLNKLTTLLLQHNQIKVLSEEVFIYMPRLNYLRLYDNPWNCTCEIETLVTMLQVPRNRNLGNYAKCTHPERLKDQKLKLMKTELLCLQEEDVGPKPIQAGPKPGTPAVDSSICHMFMFPRLSLDCRRKALETVPDDIPPDTVKLDLSHNVIKQLHLKEFEDLRSLEILNLSNNGMETIDPAAFSGLVNLQELDLSSNNLYNFEYGVLEDLYFLRKLWLRDNPWKCDYQIHYLFYWLKHHYTVNFNGLECRMPEEYKGWYVGKYVRSYYEECPKDRLQAYGDKDIDEEELEWHKVHSKHIQPDKKHGVIITVLS
ncbi:leucine-rich repeat-containing protein 17 [Ambystoma mexicanum]|uniref:leucine-rich repeat-containing protein 17 n=1 Tax=Ambystoma mexicanum TaxID=8296 RepID=UPI0037E85BD2